MAGMFVRIFKSRRRSAGLQRRVTVGALDREDVPVTALTADGFDPGLLGVIERMFSGLLIEHANIQHRAENRREEPQVPEPHIGANDIDVLATITGPRIYPLPNSPTGWGQPSRGEKIAIGVLADPGRPNGLIGDAQGLGTDAYGEMIAVVHASDETGEGRLEK